MTQAVQGSLGAAYVLFAELNDLPDARRGEQPNLSRRLRAVGHLFEAEDESQEWPELHAGIREVRRVYRANGIVPGRDSLAALAADAWPADENDLPGATDVVQ